jgi:SpoIID/LytB domain protein
VFAVALAVPTGGSGASEVNALDASTVPRGAAAPVEAVGEGRQAAIRPMAGPYGSVVKITGHGYGHGIGLSQYGAFGYAVDAGWTAAQILNHYYGGTVAGTAANSTTSVRLQALDDGQTAIVQPLGLATLGYDPFHLRWRSIVIRDVAVAGQPASYRVWARTDAAVCPSAAANLDSAGSGWLLVGNAVAAQVVVTAGAGSLSTTNVDQLLAACEPGGTVRSYRGDLLAVNGTAGENRTVNVLPMETYLRGVVGSEMPNSWGGSGGGRGAQALRAQAVAARSYALVQNRYPYARTCDTQTCQVYAGAAQRIGVTGAVTKREYPTTDAAIAATAGLVRRIGSTSGAIASTMFSSSSGGYTAPGTTFTPVVDAGDATASNPYHTWTVAVPVSSVERAFPTIGTLTLISVISRNGLGDWGGRVVSLQVRGTKGQVTTDGDAFRRAVGLRSNWFIVAAPCGTRQQPPVTGPVPATSALGLVAVTPTRIADTRNGTGTNAGIIPAGCTLVINPAGRPAGAASAIVNLTTVGNTSGGYLIAYGCGSPQPVTSAAQLVPRVTRATTTEIAVGPAGTLCIYSSTATQLVVDLLGWRAPGGAHVGSVSPRTLLDTSRVARLAPGSVTPLTVAAGAAAASIDVGVWSTTGYLTIYPCDAPRPTTSAVNAPPAGEMATNHMIVRLDGAGRFCVYASAAAHAAIDVDAVFGTSGAAQKVSAPVRKVDTRFGFGTTGALAANVVRTVDLGLASSVVTVQATLVSPAGAGALQVYSCSSWPGLGVRATGRNVNTAGMAVVATNAAGQVCLRSSVGTHALVDVLSWT